MISTRVSVLQTLEPVYLKTSKSKFFFLFKSSETFCDTIRKSRFNLFGEWNKICKCALFYGKKKKKNTTHTVFYFLLLYFCDHFVSSLLLLSPGIFVFLNLPSRRRVNSCERNEIATYPPIQFTIVQVITAFRGRFVFRNCLQYHSDKNKLFVFSVETSKYVSGMINLFGFFFSFLIGFRIHLILFSSANRKRN